MPRPYVFDSRVQGTELNAPPGGGLVGIEFSDLVRPFELSDRYANRALQRLIARRPGPSDAEASIRWGGPSRFEVRAARYPEVTISFEDDDDEATTYTVKIPVIEFNENEREYDIVRITNPDDEEQYVDVGRINRIKFIGPDLRPDGGVAGVSAIPKHFRFPFIYYEYHLEHPEEGEVIQSGLIHRPDE